MIKTKSDLKRAMQEAGSHFFDRKTMQFFQSKLHNVYTVPKGAVFITSEKEPPHGARRFKIRLYEGGVNAKTLKGDILFIEDAQAEARALVKEMRETSARRSTHGRY